MSVQDMGEVPPSEAKMEFLGMSQGTESQRSQRYLLSSKNVVLILMSSLKGTIFL